MENGGPLTQKEVFEILEQKLTNEFNEYDLEILQDGAFRWQKMAAWQKYSMKKEELLESDSQKGWVITNKGKEFLKDANLLNLL